MPSPLSDIAPLPVLIVNPEAVKASLSMSLALARSSACVIRRAPLSSAIELNVTGVVVGASLTGVISSVAIPATLSAPSVIV